MSYLPPKRAVEHPAGVYAALHGGHCPRCRFRYSKGDPVRGMDGEEIHAGCAPEEVMPWETTGWLEDGTA